MLETRYSSAEVRSIQEGLHRWRSFGIRARPLQLWIIGWNTTHKYAWAGETVFVPGAALNNAELPPLRDELLAGWFAFRT